MWILAKDIVALGKVLAWHAQTPGFSPSKHIKSGIVVYTCNPSTQEIGTGESEKSRSSLATHSKFDASLRCSRLYL